MATKVSFEIEDAKGLLKQLSDFDEVIRQDWNRVLNQWSSLESVWRDRQFDCFEPLFKKMSSTYRYAEEECEEYKAFLKEQIRIAEDRNARMGSLLDL